MFLREVLENDKEEILKIYEEYVNSEPIEGIDTFEGIRNFEHLEKMSFEEWYEELEKNKNKENLPLEFSPQTSYLVIKDNEIVGILNARWERVPILVLYGGLIGYSIRPKFRGMGYANEMLKLGLEKFKERNINEVIISSKDFNIPSIKVIERNNGIKEKEYKNPDDGYNYYVYTIKI